jgi:hypothetical protein
MVLMRLFVRLATPTKEIIVFLLGGGLVDLNKTRELVLPNRMIRKYPASAFRPICRCSGKSIKLYPIN